MLLSYDGCDRLNWRKAKRSINNGACAEVASSTGVIVVRDSQDPQGLALAYPANSWNSFIAAARTGAFDNLR
jgi:hypothetical protein